MRKNNLITIYGIGIGALFLISFSVFSSEDASGHLQSVSYVQIFKHYKWHLLNAFIMFSVLIHLNKKRVIEHFKGYRQKVNELYEFAKEKSRESQIKYDIYIKKMEGVKTLTQNIHDESDKEGRLFTQKIEQEMKDKIKKMEIDSEKRLDGERTRMILELKQKLIEAVLAKAQEKIKANSDLQEKTASKLIAKVE